MKPQPCKNFGPTRQRGKQEEETKGKEAERQSPEEHLTNSPPDKEESSYDRRTWPKQRQHCSSSFLLTGFADWASKTVFGLKLSSVAQQLVGLSHLALGHIQQSGPIFHMCTKVFQLFLGDFVRLESFGLKKKRSPSHF